MVGDPVSKTNYAVRVPGPINLLDFKRIPPNEVSMLYYPAGFRQRQLDG